MTINTTAPHAPARRLSLSLTSFMVTPHQSNAFESEDCPSFFPSCNNRMSMNNVKRWTVVELDIV